MVEASKMRRADALGASERATTVEHVVTARSWRELP
jgi:hypothetical protein